MASFRVLYKDNTPASRTRVAVSVDGGGMAEGFTDSRGYVNIKTSGTYGSIYVGGKEIHRGSLNVGEVRIR